MEHQHIWDKVLGPNEEIKYEFTVGEKYRRLGLIGFVVTGVICALLQLWFLALVCIGTGAFYFGFYLKAANAYAFTDHRVLSHRGLLSTKMISTEYQKITDVTVIEPFFSRVLFNIGTLEIDTAGTKKQEIVLNDVEAPYEIKKRLDSLRGHQ